MTRQRTIGYGRGEHTITTAELDELMVDPEEVRTHVRRAFAAPDYHPPRLPAVALEVQRMSTAKDVDLSAVVAVLERDPMLVSEVLRVAQSPFFARRVPPSSISEAVSRLGLSNIRDIVFGVTFSAKVMRAPGYSELSESIRKHSVASAYVARRLARGTPVAEYAFLCGLLHDIGLTAIALVLGGLGRKVAPEALMPVLRELHEEAGRVVALAWELPPSLEPAIAAHHAPSSKEAALALVAHQVAAECGFGVEVSGMDGDTSAPVSVAEACRTLRLTDEGLDALRAEADSLLIGI